MMTAEEQTRISELFFDKFKAVEDKYLALVAAQLQEIGTLSATSVHRLDAMVKMRQNVQQIESLLSTEMSAAITEMQRQLGLVAADQYADASAYYESAGVKQVSVAKNAAVQRVIAAVADTTARAMRNIASTSIVSRAYQEAVDTAILAVTTGVADYKSVMRDAVRNVASQGISYVVDGTNKIQYPSGTMRRMDSAVKMNVLDGIHQVNLGVAEATGRDFGADGYAITSHASPAPDHEDIDGEVYSKAGYERLNASLKRAVGTKNCRHFAIPVRLDTYRSPRSDGYKQKRHEQNKRPLTIGGKDRTVYEWRQESNRLKNQALHHKDVASMADVMGDADLKAASRMAQRAANARARAIDAKIAERQRQVAEELRNY